MSVELASLICYFIIAVSTLSIAIYLNKIQEIIEFIRRNIYSINDELKYQYCIREIVMKLDRIANTLDTLNKEDGENNED